MREAVYLDDVLAVVVERAKLWSGTLMGDGLNYIRRQIERLPRVKEKIMEVKIKLDPGAIMPTRAHSTDAGLDLYAPEDIKVPACRWYAGCVAEAGSAIIDTRTHIQIPPGYVGFLKSKSGLNVRYGITSEGVIDSGYTGSIVVKLYNHSDEPYIIAKGQKISQLVILPIVTPELVEVDELDETERGNGGFGSTGK